MWILFVRVVSKMLLSLQRFVYQQSRVFWFPIFNDYRQPLNGGTGCYFTQMQNVQVNWSSAVVFVVCSSAAFWRRHRWREVTHMSVFFTASPGFVVSEASQWAWCFIHMSSSSFETPHLSWKCMINANFHMDLGLISPICENSSPFLRKHTCAHTHTCACTHTHTHTVTRAI